ncbi:MAG: cytochrome c biogenesis heme-transporting ATPase CcmA [Ramlibacter sp.]
MFAGVGFAVGEGEWLHVRGENGSGKTSLLRMLAGLAPAETGEVRWCGRPISEDTHAYHRDLMFLGHHAAVKQELTALENLTLAAELDGQELAEADAMPALRRFGLKGREDLAVRYLSAGQKRRVLLARLVTRKARLWVLDEPFTALDTQAVDLLATVVSEHLGQGGVAVITSHQAVPIASGKVLEL